jgi:hypothetical protein
VSRFLDFRHDFVRLYFTIFKYNLHHSSFLNLIFKVKLQAVMAMSV